jgi:GNAT superfamily N-acetyltransferase
VSDLRHSPAGEAAKRGCLARVGPAVAPRFLGVPAVRRSTLRSRLLPTAMIRVAPAAPQEYEAALELLFDRLSPAERHTSVKDVLRSLGSGRITRHGLLAAWNDQILTGAILYAIQRDRTAFVWAPRTRGGDADRPIADALVGALRAGVDGAGAWIAQALLDPAAHDDADALDRNGFTHLTDLRFLVHILGNLPPQLSAGAEVDDEEFEIITYEPGVHDERLARLLERTYVGTQDCPEVGGRRSGTAAVESHRMSGDFDPARWKIYRVSGRDAGALLLNAHPEHSAWEVVYMGVGHDCRGLGLGRRMVRDALAAARDAEQSALLLAVDSRNDYASKVYDELGFVETDRKGVHIYFPSAGVPSDAPQ